MQGQIARGAGAVLQSATMPRAFYGWFIVLIAALGGFVVAGTGYAAFGQFIGPLAQTFGWSVGIVAFASTARLLVGIGAAPWIGVLVDRYGPRAVLTGGALITGGAYVALGWISEAWLFYVIFSAVLALGFQLLAGIPAQAAVTRWFRRRRGMALAMLSMGSSFGGVVLVPLVQWLLETGGWRFAFGAIGGAVLCGLAPLAAFGMRNAPEEIGLSADGEEAAPAASAAPVPGAPGDERRWTARAMLGSADFRAIAVGLLFSTSLFTLIEVYQFSILTSRGVEGTTAAWFIALYSLCAALSKFGWGYLADRANLPRLLMVVLWLNAGGLAVLSIADHAAWYWIYTTISGASGGGLAALTPALIARHFGRRSYGTVAGLLAPLTMAAPALAVPLAGFVFDATGGYAAVFGGVAALAMVTSLSLLRVGRPAGMEGGIAVHGSTS